MSLPSTPTPHAMGEARDEAAHSTQGAWAMQGEKQHRVATRGRCPAPPALGRAALKLSALSSNQRGDARHQELLGKAAGWEFI